MSDHQQIRQLLALAAAGALPDAQLARVERHLAQCGECAAAFAQYDAITQSLRRLPTPQPSALAVERARIAALDALQAARQLREHVVTVVFLGVFAWSFTLAGGVISLLLFGGPAELGRVFSGHVPFWLAVFSALGWTAAGAAAIVLGARHREQGRLA